MRSSLILDIAKACIGVFLGCVAATLVPIYGEPFTGCLDNGWLVAEAGCGHWPEALRGFLVMLPIAALSSSAQRFVIFANALLIVLSFVGGIEAMKAGDVYHSTFSVVSSAARGYPLAVGGILATVGIYAAKRVFAQILKKSVA